jgi:hypothetical protein
MVCDLTYDLYTTSLAAALQLSIKTKLGQTDTELQFVPCINPSTYPPVDWGLITLNYCTVSL